MSWFHFTKQERLKDNRRIRRELAEQARKHAAENPYAITGEIKEALGIATDEERTFADYFGEPLPPHVAAALQLELVLWQRLQAAVERERTQATNEQRYDAFQEGIHSLLLTLINLLHAEEEMVTSCLVQHYLTITKHLEADAARVTW